MQLYCHLLHGNDLAGSLSFQQVSIKRKPKKKKPQKNFRPNVNFFCLFIKTYFWNENNSHSCYYFSCKFPGTAKHFIVKPKDPNKICGIPASIQKINLKRPENKAFVQLPRRGNWNTNTGFFFFSRWRLLGVRFVLRLPLPSSCYGKKSLKKGRKNAQLH